ncbi:antigen 5 like allergen Cul n 1-like [Drosophila miranda]|uniref:antigen 5 like allergen Cul n 1 n=1 Tax=Drosophila miranda TaxID=7229 RepID=UPI00143F5EB7|nr:antigen 5 like allergen Cul n 1 [Drosophila miranda]XP_033254064.1 antigen 5 like allergen Cul n 1-like [Drosophila miranda]
MFPAAFHVVFDHGNRHFPQVACRGKQIATAIAFARQSDLVLFCLFSCGYGWDYCQEHWCSRPALQHVACNNNGSLGAKCKSGARLIPISADMQQFIVRQVNLYRNQVASAERMATVQWDPELANLAEFAVKQCHLATDNCRNTRRFKRVGQIVGHVIFSANRFSQRQLIGHKIYNWFNQYKKATAGLGLGLRKDITSFRQLIQERATYMGCGFLQQQRHRWQQQFIVCNFARKNVHHEPAYAIGHKAAAGCQKGTNPQFPNQCAVEEPFDVNAVDRYVPKPMLLIKMKYSEDGMESIAAKSRPKRA